MKADVAIIGAELDGLIAAIRLAELGRNVAVIAPAAGSLHYAAGGVRVLGYLRNGAGREEVVEPFAALARLDRSHPYSLAGGVRVREALDWSARLNVGNVGVAVEASECNELGLTPAGLRQPIWLPTVHQATIGRINGRKPTIVRFDGHLDFPADLIQAGLKRSGIDAACIAVGPPGPHRDNPGIARNFDRMSDTATYFATIRQALPAGTEIVLMPAVLGLARHEEIVSEAQAALGIPVFEVPTLPPSVPGMRWVRSLETFLAAKRATFRRNVRIVHAERDGNRIRSISDENGRTIEAGAFVLATGGVLMGGLDVDAAGQVSETAFGLDVAQGRPLVAGSPSATLAALHCSGIETDDRLRPKLNGSGAIQNLFVTGRTLAHWHPAEEVSAEGVSIVTGWMAAEYAHSVLEG